MGNIIYITIFMGFDIHGTFICIHNSINTLILSGDSQVIINNLTDRDFRGYLNTAPSPWGFAVSPERMHGPNIPGLISSPGGSWVAVPWT